MALAARHTSDPGSNAPLVASEVTKAFGGVRALKGVSLEVSEARVVGLIGPNGSGKTTLLNCMSGVIRPTSGCVALGERDITRRTPAEIARMGIARTFQNIRLFERLTVLENVRVNALSAARLGSRRASELAGDLIEEFGLCEVADRYVSDLSYGDRRRVEIARALAGRPRFVLLDEPAAGMNESETEALGVLIERIRADRGCGVLLVDHDLELIMLHCERITVLNEGKEIACGSPVEVQSNEAVIAAYIGSTTPSEKATTLDRGDVSNQLGLEEKR